MLSRLLPASCGSSCVKASAQAAAASLVERDPRLVTTRVIRKRSDDVRDSARLRARIALDLDASPVFASTL